MNKAEYEFYKMELKKYQDEIPYAKKAIAKTEEEIEIAKKQLAEEQDYLIGLQGGIGVFLSEIDRYEKENSNANY